MPTKPKSNARRAHEFSKERDDLIDEAAQIYLTEQTKPKIERCGSRYDGLGRFRPVIHDYYNG